MAPKDDYNHVSLFEAMVSYFPDFMCVGPQGINRKNTCGYKTDTDNSLNSKVRFSSDIRVMPSIVHTLTPPPHDELWYTDKEYKKFEKHYQYHLMEKRSRSLFSPPLEESSGSSSTSDNSSECIPSSKIGRRTEEPQKINRKLKK